VARGGDILVAGAGAVGSTIALKLARAGWRVTVADPAPVGANASGVAAGMLAPAFESLFDEIDPARFPLLAQARDAWSAFSRAAGLTLVRDGAVAVGTEREVEAWERRLSDLGARRRILAPAEAAELAPGLRSGHWALFSPEDWRIDPRVALAGLRRQAEALGARLVSSKLIGFDAGLARLEGQASVAVDFVVLATGAALGPLSIAPELVALTPVKGHILRSPQTWPAKVTVRTADVYLCPADDGLALGASMEPGRADLAVDRKVVEALLAAAERLAPDLRQRAWRAETGVRAATSDGLPLVGPSRTPGVILAVGARRNGWLLAPLIAEAVLDVVEGRAVRGPADQFDPSRLMAPG
jgi:glycine oxidase